MLYDGRRDAQVVLEARRRRALWLRQRFTFIIKDDAPSDPFRRQHTPLLLPLMKSNETRRFISILNGKERASDLSSKWASGLLFLEPR